MSSFLGGPLDGARYEGKIDRDNPFVIMECTKDGHEAQLYCCYRLVDENFVFVSSKTKEQFLSELAKEDT